MPTPSILEDRLLTKTELADKLRITQAAVSKWVRNGRGPRHVKVGSRTLFRESDLNAWVEERTRISSTQAA